MRDLLRFLFFLFPLLIISREIQFVSKTSGQLTSECTYQQIDIITKRSQYMIQQNNMKIIQHMLYLEKIHHLNSSNFLFTSSHDKKDVSYFKVKNFEINFTERERKQNCTWPATFLSFPSFVILMFQNIVWN